MSCEIGDCQNSIYLFDSGLGDLNMKSLLARLNSRDMFVNQWGVGWEIWVITDTKNVLGNTENHGMKKQITSPPVNTGTH